MAPKKKPVEEKKILLGRPSNNLKAGVVGLPNVGKSTFFNILTKSQAPAENFPFCTIDPQESRVIVPDERFDWLVQKFKPASVVPANLTVMDIAGLVKGAHEGQGLGNEFLSHVRAVDAIFHMIRCFDSDEIVHVEGDVNPIRDLEIIHEELRMKDEAFILKNLEELERKGVSRGGAKEKKQTYETLVKLRECVVEQKKDVRMGEWTNKDIDELNTMRLLTAKPILYLVNLSQKDFLRKKNKWLLKIKNWIDEREKGCPIIPFSCEFEQALADLPDDEKPQFLKSLGEDVQSQMPKIITTGYKTLRLFYYFTASSKEVRAWTLREGLKAPQAAGIIHTDFERGFIMAEVMKFADLKEYGSESEVKAKGKYMMKGRDYVVENGDIILFKFNVSDSNKSKK